MPATTQEPRATAPRLIPIVKAAELLEVSPRVIDAAVEAGRLQAFTVGRRVLVRRDALLSFLADGEG